MTSERALRFDASFYPSWWDHHRGGWRLAIERLAAELHHDDGVLFLPAIEDIFAVDPHTCITEPWAGFVHQAPQQGLRFPDLERLIDMRGWRRSMDHCVGLWTLTDYQRRYLKGRGVSVPISVVPYPCDTSVAPFDLDAFLAGTPRRLVMIAIATGIGLSAAVFQHGHMDLGFAASHPNANPKAAGATIETGGHQYSYGELGALFYNSNELSDVFSK